MALSSKKANCCDHMDRISDLPSGVIDGILEHLNIRDLVRTSILSRKWQYMWISVPQLEFEDDFFNRYEHFKEDPGPEISRVITDVLWKHNEPIYKFTLHIPYIPITITIDYLSKWILFLSMRGIKHLELLDNSLVPGQMPLPYDVFSCQDLTYFKLRGFDLSVPPNFYGFKSLLVLHLEGITFKSSALQNLVSGCPVLEELSIVVCFGCECLDFSSPTVKVLRIDVDGDVESICLKKVKNLIDLTIQADRPRASGLIKSLPSIQRLFMDSLITKILYADIIPTVLLRTSFCSLEYLKWTGVDLNDRKELVYIGSVISYASNLVELVIESYTDVDHTTQGLNDLEELECNQCCLSLLHTVVIRVEASCRSAMSLIRFILRYSPSLQILIFKNLGLSSKKSDAPELFSISRDLLRMERASRRAIVEMIHG